MKRDEARVGRERDADPTAGRGDRTTARQDADTTARPGVEATAGRDGDTTAGRGDRTTARQDADPTAGRSQDVSRPNWPLLAAAMALAGVAGAFYLLLRRRRPPDHPSRQETQRLEVVPTEAPPVQPQPPQPRPPATRQPEFPLPEFRPPPVRGPAGLQSEPRPVEIPPPATQLPAAPAPEDRPQDRPAAEPPPRARPSAGRPSRASIIAAIVAKDLTAFTRDWFWGFMTVLVLVWIIGLYYFLPDTVNETITVGVHQSGMDALFDLTDQAEEGIEWVAFDSTAALEAALGLGPEQRRDKRSWLEVALGRGKGDDEPEAATSNELDIGIDFPADFLARVAAGEATTVTVFVDAGVPVEVRNAIASFVREGAYSLTGNVLPVTVPRQETIVLGEDRAGHQVAFREKLRPFFAFMVLLMETFALGALIAEEVTSRSVTAVLTTPVRISDYLAAKSIVGTTIAFTEAVVIMLFLRSFQPEPLILALTLLLGAVLVTGVALIAGASGRDYVGMAFYSMLFLVPLLIPVIAVLFPGTASPWVRALPTYGLAQTINGVQSYGYGWTEAMPHLATLAAWCVVVFVIGLVVLRRKVESL